MKHNIIILPDGTVIKELTGDEAKDPTVNIRNAAYGIGGLTGKLVGRLVYNDATRELELEAGAWDVDPDDKRDVPADQKRRKWVPTR